MQKMGVYCAINSFTERILHADKANGFSKYSAPELRHKAEKSTGAQKALQWVWVKFKG